MKRRNKKEIAAGMTVEQKQSGMTIDDINVMQTATMMNNRPDVPKRKEIILVDETPKRPTPPKPKEIKERKTSIKKEIIKEIRILNKGEEISFRQVLEDEFADGKWEWKEIPLDADFTLNTIKSAGKQGWKFAFVFERRVYIPTSKLPDVVLFHRLLK